MSKFKGLLDAVKEPAEEEPAAKPAADTPAPRRKAAPKKAVAPTPAPEPPPPVPEASPKSTRPMGRSRDPRYSKAMMYIPVELHEETKRLLIGSGQNFSELCEELIQAWVERTKR